MRFEPFMSCLVRAPEKAVDQVLNSYAKQCFDNRCIARYDWLKLLISNDRVAHVYRMNPYEEARSCNL